MKPTRRVTAGGGAVADPMTSLLSAAGPGTLIAMLRGEGLSPEAVRHLLRPESVLELRALLTARVFPDLGIAPGPIATEPQTGELLAFHPGPRPRA